MSAGRLRGFRLCVTLALGLYAAAVAASPLLHHDFACHLTSPTHCTACAASPVAPRASEAPPPVTTGLPQSGRVEAPGQQACPPESPRRIPARAPPA